jgi:hypothetical protein
LKAGPPKISLLNMRKTLGIEFKNSKYYLIVAKYIRFV